MQKIAKFHKVSEEQFVRDWCKETRCTEAEARAVYQNLRLPRRATAGSAGIRLFRARRVFARPARDHQDPDRHLRRDRGGLGAPDLSALRAGLSVRACSWTTRSASSTVIIITPRTGGHIFIKMTNCSRLGQTVSVGAGEGFAQGIFLPFGVTEDDDADGVREGGFGSTNNR